MRRLAFFSLALTVAILSLSALPAQTLAQETPPPELQHLNAFVGEWTFEGSGGGSGTQVCDWIGEYFLHCETEGTNSSGEATNMVTVWGYDAEEEVFTLHRFLNSGWSDFSKGWLNEGTWMLLFDSPNDPWGTRYRMTMAEESPNVWSVKMERSDKAGPWEVYAESKSTLTKIR